MPMVMDREMYRVMRSGAMLSVIELSVPSSPLVRPLYRYGGGVTGSGTTSEPGYDHVDSGKLAERAECQKDVSDQFHGLTAV